MAQVFIPAELRTLVASQEVVQAQGETVAQLLDDLSQRFPELRDRLCEGNQLRPGLAISVGSKISALGLLQPVSPDDEVHFLPSVGGG